MSASTGKNAMTNVLVTGFEPFGGEIVNPSWEAVRALQGVHISAHLIQVRCLPVVFGDALQELRAAIAKTRPALVICVGQAGGRGQISLERIAINVDDARIADNAGRCPVDMPVVADGPAGYFSTLPIKRILAELQRASIPAEISQSAGTYVCNHVFYGLMHELARHDGVRGGFVHIPFSPEQSALHPETPSLPVATVTAALRIIVREALDRSPDPKIGAGTTH
jgi:pyroglutamyl-peptidase